MKNYLLPVIAMLLLACGKNSVSKSENQSTADSLQQPVNGTKNDEPVSGNDEPGKFNYTPLLPVDKKAFDRLTNEIKELTLPAKIEVTREIPVTWRLLTKEETDMFIPDYQMENKSCKVYAMQKISMNNGTGLLFYIQLPPADPEEFDNNETTDRIILTLFDNNRSYSTDHILAEREYSVTYSIIGSLQEIVTIEHSEMEFIRIIQTAYSIDGLSITQLSEKEAEFKSSEEGNEESQKYIRDIEKKWF